MNRKAILCVDDDISFLKSLREEISQSFSYDEYEIIIAESADEALKIIKERQGEKCEVPLVIADYIMPGIKGDELLKYIHQISPATVKLMLTGQASIDGVANAINQAQLFRLIEKPWEAEELKHHIEEGFSEYEKNKAIDKENKELRDKHNILENINFLKEIHEPLLRIKSKIDESLNDFKKSPEDKDGKNEKNLYDQSIHEIDSIIESLNDKKNKNSKEDS